MFKRRGKTMKKQPIFRKLLFPLMGMVIIEIMILVGSVVEQGIIQKLNDNEKAIIEGRIDSRKNYLENEMVSSWMNLGYTAGLLNKKMESLIEAGDISLETLDDSSDEAMPFLSESVENILSMMRTNHVTGAFVVLNTSDLSQDMETKQYKDKPGVYFRDDDPEAQPSFLNQDILINRAPVAIVQKLGIATDTSWNPKFEFEERAQSYYDFLYKPFQAAYNNPEYSMEDCGYWSTPFQLNGEGKTIISYSIPLKLNDGTVYGVIGIDITEDYLGNFLPASEIEDSGRGAYFMAQEDAENKYTDIVLSGTLYGDEIDSGKPLKIDKSKYYVHAHELNLYNNNAPFSEDKWVLVGMAPLSDIMQFAQSVQKAMMAAVGAMLLIGIVGSFLISYMVQKPVFAISREIEKKDPGKQIKLADTGIREIDQMTDAIEKLSKDVIESGQKFTKIIEMASVSMAGFQVDKGESALFLTEDFFDIFGKYDVDESNITLRQFVKEMNELAKYLLEEEMDLGNYIFRIPSGRDNRFLKLRYAEDDNNYYGLVEDVTQSLLEKKVLKHERDHDLLTNLYNRRAFYREVQELFAEHPETIKSAALIMLDLDNLKYINDTFGHDYGDKYIVKAALALQYYLPPKALTARIAGDEFNIFIYGYEKNEDIMPVIDAMKAGINSMVVQLPGDIEQKIQASGGIAWYKKDSSSFEELMKYADHAMYMVKNSKKGEIRSFDLQYYQAQNALHNNRAALITLLERRAVKYAFQPIVDTHTGEVFAYEALMRPDMPEFKSVLDVLEVAKYEGKLNQIEEMTWFEAMRAFVVQEKAGNISPDCCIFVNSIPNQALTKQLEYEFFHEFKEYVGKVVMELTEGEQLEKEFWEDRQKIYKQRGLRIALDDYGTGYNSEKMLITVMPDYIKVDIAIVKDIDQSTDKQAMVEYIVNYAHQRNRYIIAEGVENEEEMETVIRLGVDYVQGYYVAKPSFIPEKISEQAKATIERMNQSIE